MPPQFVDAPQLFQMQATLANISQALQAGQEREKVLYDQVTLLSREVHTINALMQKSPAPAPAVLETSRGRQPTPMPHGQAGAGEDGSSYRPIMRGTPMKFADYPKLSGKAPPGEEADYLERWVTTMESCFAQHYQYEDSYRVNLMASALTDQAKDWWHTARKKGLIVCATTEPPEPGITTWKEFKELLWDRFVPIDADEVTRTRYKILIQPESISLDGFQDFVSTFQEIHTKLGTLDEKQKIYDFMSSLRPGELKRHLQEVRYKVTTCDELIKSGLQRQSEIMSTKTLSQAMKKNAPQQSQGQSNTHYKGQRHYGPPRAAAENRGVSPMEVNAMQQQRSGGKPPDKGAKDASQPRRPAKSPPGVSDALFKERREKGLCTWCGDASHWAPSCPKKTAYQAESGNGRRPPQGGQDTQK